MGNAFWLFTALPKWFFSSVLSPFGAGALTLIPAIGTVCLVLGVVLAIRLRIGALWTFAIPALISQVFVAMAGYFRGAFTNSSAGPILTGFLTIQMALSFYLVYRQRKQWPPASLLAVFNIAYALYAWFIATMAFTDQWL